LIIPENVLSLKVQLEFVEGVDNDDVFYAMLFDGKPDAPSSSDSGMEISAEQMKQQKKQMGVQ